MKRYILHIHTKYSVCSNCEPRRILEIVKKKGFDGVVITDHNTIRGALEARRINQDDDFEVVIGEEVSTDIGHVLVFYVKKEIKPTKVELVVDEARKQDALCILAHPYNILQSKLKKFFPVKEMRMSLTEKDQDKVKMFDAIEGFNARSLIEKDNLLSQKLAKLYNKPIVAGSDSHFENEICRTWVEFDDSLDLRQAILQNKINFYGERRYVLFNKLLSTYRIFNKKYFR